MFSSRDPSHLLLWVVVVGGGGGWREVGGGWGVFSQVGFLTKTYFKLISLKAGTSGIRTIVKNFFP